MEEGSREVEEDRERLLLRDLRPLPGRLEEVAGSREEETGSKEEGEVVVRAREEVARTRGGAAVGEVEVAETPALARSCRPVSTSAPGSARGCSGPVWRAVPRGVASKQIRDHSVQ